MIDFPSPGPYRVLVDAYPAAKGAPRNFQLHEDVNVAGAYHPQPLPPYSPNATVDGYHVRLTAPRTLHAIEPASHDGDRDRPVRQAADVHALVRSSRARRLLPRRPTLDYFHTHVCGPNTPGCTSVFGGARVTGTSSKPGKLQVGVLLPVAGTWQLFLQFQAGGRVLTAPFTLKVQ